MYFTGPVPAPLSDLLMRPSLPVMTNWLVFSTAQLKPSVRTSLSLVSTRHFSATVTVTVQVALLLPLVMVNSTGSEKSTALPEAGWMAAPSDTLLVTVRAVTSVS